MERFIKYSLCTFFCMFFVSISAQRQPSMKDYEHAKVYEIFTAEQKVMFDKAKAENDILWKKFDASLSAAQRAIKEDKTLDREKRKEAMDATLTAEQRAMLKLIHETMNKQKEQFRATLTNEQKEALRKIMKK